MQTVLSQIQEPTVKKRPIFLAVLCVFTLVYNIKMASSELSSFFNSHWQTKLFGIDGLLFLLRMLTSAGRVFGAWKMWNLKKNGFVIYSVASVALSLTMSVIFTIIGFFDKQAMLGVACYMSFLIGQLAVIGLYATQRKHMN